MNLKGSNSSSRLCACCGKPPQKLAFFSASNWSGREDSNLRPLPPEGGAPARIRCFAMAFQESPVASDGPCSRLVAGVNLGLNFRPLCSQHERVRV
jgi:hypothetical protein